MRNVLIDVLGPACVAASLIVTGCGETDRILDEASLRTQIRRDLACDSPTLRPLRRSDVSQPSDVVLVEGCDAPAAFYCRSEGGRWALDPTMAAELPAE